MIFSSGKSVFHQLNKRCIYNAYLLIIFCSFCCTPCPGYEPTRTISEVEETHAFDLKSSHADRAIPLRVSLPETRGPLPVILFSQGLGGSRNGYKYLRTRWTGRGYATIFLQHPGSDESLLNGVSPSQAVRQLRGAATRKNMNLRVDDVTDVLNAMSEWASDWKSPFYGRLDLSNIRMAGHSMGAITSQLVIGQPRLLSTTKNDKRIQAAVLLSPSCPPFQCVKSAFGSVTIPCHLLTGTRDNLPFF